MSLPADDRFATRMQYSRMLSRTLKQIAMVFAAMLATACLLTAQAPAPTPAPSTAQNTSATSSAAVTAGESKPASVIATPAPSAGQNSPHLTATTGPAPEDVNRKALEESAGKDAGKILMRSIPSRARIYVNGAFVGYTPQLFMLAPGKYKIEMRGQRDNYAERTTGLLPNDTQEITLNLTARYPLHVGSH
jgi:outer membrane receptor protein involved in Fe transport